MAKVGDYARTHSLSQLLSDWIGCLSPEEAPAWQTWVAEKRATIRELELAYLEARHFPVPYTQEQVQAMAEWVEALKERLDAVL